MGPTLSIVAPVYNEESHVAEFIDRCLAAARRSGIAQYELILVDDGSADRSGEVIEQKIHEHPGALRLVVLSRNFGQQPAFHAGLAAARGEMVVTLDSDLQDPPELIPELVDKIRQGFDVVFARRVSDGGGSFGASGHSGLRSVGAYAFHWMISRVRSNPLPRDVGEYRIMKRELVDRLLGFPEGLLLIPGLVAYLGFDAGFVDYVRSQRADRSRTSLAHLTARAADTLTMFSIAPINLVVALGLLTWVLPAALGIWMLVGLATGQRPGTVSLVVLAMLVVWCATLTVLVVVAHYVGRIFIETKRRPKYFVKRTVGGPLD